MKLALSNFAWDKQNQDICFQILKHNNVNNIEIIFNKIKERFDLKEEELINYYKTISNYGINIYSAQSLFYNTHVNDMSDNTKIIEIFTKLINYAKILKIEVLVFGSPSIRKKFLGWESIIQNIFLNIDNLLKDTNITLVIEPNSKIYNGEFFITLDEIVSFIKKNSFSNIKTMIDTHNLIAEKICPIEMLHKYKEYISHIHISELGLTPLSDIPFHINFSRNIHMINYDKVITYEVNNSDFTLESILTFSNIYLKNDNTNSNTFITP